MARQGISHWFEVSNQRSETVAQPRSPEGRAQERRAPLTVRTEHPRTSWLPK